MSIVNQASRMRKVNKVLVKKAETGVFCEANYGKN